MFFNKIARTGLLFLVVISCSTLNAETQTTEGKRIPTRPLPSVVDKEKQIPLVPEPLLVDGVDTISSVESSTLPPDPGKKGKEDLLGIDSDGDGVRDDIERYIVHKYPELPALRRGLYQLAQVKQHLFQYSDPDIWAKYAQAQERAIRCVSFYDPEGAYNAVLDLDAEYLNTKERYKMNSEIDASGASVITIQKAKITDCL